MSYLTRQLALAALTANALRPPRGFRAAIPAFFAGWLTSELAPHLLALSAVDTTQAILRGRSHPLGLVAAAGSAAGLAHMVRQSQQVRSILEDALVEGLGVDYAGQLDVAPTPAELAVPWREIARPFSFGGLGVRVDRNLAYTDAGRRGHLDVYRPDVEDLRGAPMLLQVHGGAWILGEKEHQGLPLMHHLASKGWVCFAINYRLSPRTAFPAHIVDVKRAIAWVKQHAEEYGGDASYLAITGGSAGGHLAALAALTPADPYFQPDFEDADTSVSAAVPFYGVYDWAGSTGLLSAEMMRDRFLAPRVMQQTWAAAPELFERASPILRITDEAPDFFVLHGSSDTMVPVDQARLFVERLRQISRHRVLYAELPGAQHAFDVFHSIRSEHVVRAVERFLAWSWNGHRRGAVPVMA